MANQIKKTLMERDGLTATEAKEEMNYVREMMEDAIANGDYFEAEEIFEEEFGLELDYIFDLF